jgi:hypothetical protein
VTSDSLAYESMVAGGRARSAGTSASVTWTERNVGFSLRLGEPQCLKVETLGITPQH